MLRDRRHLAEDGLVVPVVAINKQTGGSSGAGHHHAGLRHWSTTADELLADGARVIAEVIEQPALEERTDQGLIKEKTPGRAAPVLPKRSGRRPLVLPVIMEI